MSARAKAKCPNCRGVIHDHPQDGCILAALIQIIRDRESVGERELLELHQFCNVDRLWNDLGAVIDRLEEGVYRT